MFFKFPTGSTRDGPIRVEVLGETTVVLREALADGPPGLDETVERIGPSPDTGGDIQALLTDRQRAVLDIALSLGSNNVPRQATHSDIAERLDRSVAPVGEHLQKIECRVFTPIRPYLSGRQIPTGVQSHHVVRL